MDSLRLNTNFTCKTIDCHICGDKVTARGELIHATHLIHAKCLSTWAQQQINNSVVQKKEAPTTIRCFVCQVDIPIKDIEACTNVMTAERARAVDRSLDETGLLSQRSEDCCVIL